jgi:hypothetical protein
MKLIHTGLGICLECRKPLQEKTCPACDGKRNRRQLLISKRLCTRGKGSGKVYQLSDQNSHNEDDLREIKKSRIDIWIRSNGQSAIIKN